MRNVCGGAKTVFVFIQSLSFCLLIALATASQAQTTYQINSSSDAPQSGSASTGQCWTGGFVNGTPECTLRAAIQAANQTSDQAYLEFESIPVDNNDFSYFTINSELPAISSRIEIRGQTHPLWSSGRTNVILRGSTSGAIQSYNGLTFVNGSNNSRVESIGVSSFNDGIVIDGASNVTIVDSYISGGLANASFTARNGRDGIRMINNASQNVISNSFIRGNGRYGIWIGSGASNNAIISNRFGVRPFGSTFMPPADSANGNAGILVASNAGTGNQLGSFTGNYMANNGDAAIRVLADGQLITNNRIGVPPAEGVATNYEPEDYFNDGIAAVSIWSSDNQMGTGGSTGNTIGGPASQTGILLGLVTPFNAPANDNVIAGNLIGLNDNDEAFGMDTGIEVLQGSSNTIRNNVIANNSIGIRTYSTSSSTAIRSNQILDNGNEGLRLTGGAIVGGEDFVTANVIGGSGRGIYVISSNGSVVVRNNYIGTNADADQLTNTTGIQVQNNDSFVDIGGVGWGNVIGNSTGSGIYLASGADRVWVKSNHIGVHPDGTPMGNSRGVRISGGADAFSNRIGYRLDRNINALDFFGSEIAGTRGNIIANSSAQGVWVSGGDDAVLNSIRGNRFFGNGGRDIDLGMDSIVGGGGSTGPNTQLNWPELSTLTNYNPSTGEATVAFRVSTFSSNAAYPLQIDLYLISETDPERPVYIHSIEYPASSAVNVVTETFPWPEGLPFDGQLVATASDNIDQPYGNTSQFSPPYSLSLGPGALATTTNNNGSGGVFLNLEALDQGLQITGFDLAFSGSAGTSVDVEVYVREGSYEGEADNPSAWTLHDTMSFERAGTTAFAAADLSEVIAVPAGETRGVYLQALSSDGVRYSGTAANPPQAQWSNDDLSLFSDTATTSATPFGGSLFSPRSFSGVIRYDVVVVDELFNDRFEQ